GIPRHRADRTTAPGAARRRTLRRRRAPRAARLIGRRRRRDRAGRPRRDDQDQRVHAPERLLHPRGVREARLRREPRRLAQVHRAGSRGRRRRSGADAAPVRPRRWSRMNRAARLAAILDLLAAQGEVSVDQLVERFGASAATTRRDLDSLAERRLLTRTHGGAVAQSVAYELPIRYRSHLGTGAKERIAATAA